MSWLLAALKAIPLWLVLALAAGGVIWWQHGQIEKARADAASLNDQVQQCQQARNNLVALANEQG
ncbi:hypothetical protein G7007_21820, partial [Pseudomonas entomophila]|uniref:hypothetical protein n=1 Tax=Pseudomonas entomophila TaxID=312306 RepID=UPI0015E46BAF